MSISYFKYKRGAVDVCNICLQVKQLTYDHVPPKGGIELKPIEIHAIYEKVNSSKVRPLTSQNGLKFRFICADCNSKLGVRYDKALNSFTRDVAMFLNSNLYFPSSIFLKAKPVRMIRSLVGHLSACASDVNRIGLEKKLREYVFDEEATLPDDINISYWIYPYEQTIIKRDIGIFKPNSPNKDMYWLQIMKYFPIAFLISDKPGLYGLQELTIYKHLKLDDEVELKVRINERRDADWPDRVEEDEIMFLTTESENAVRAVPKNKR